MRTYSPKPADITRQWYVLDASQLPLGRLSTTVASLLLGKGKTSFSPHMDGGDFVVVINASKLKVTGNKLADKRYYRHSGYPSGLTEQSLSEVLVSNPEKVIHHAVRGMLPANKLRPARLARLKVYPGEEHNHTAQKPVNFELGKKK